MMKWFRIVLNWWKRGAFYKFKIAMFSILVSAIFFDFLVDVDFKEKSITFSDSGAEPIPIYLIITLVLCLISLVYFDFRLEVAKRRDRNFQDLNEFMKSVEISEKLKEDYIEFLNKRY